MKANTTSLFLTSIAGASRTCNAHFVFLVSALGPQGPQPLSLNLLLPFPAYVLGSCTVVLLKHYSLALRDLRLQASENAVVGKHRWVFPRLTFKQEREQVRCAYRDRKGRSSHRDARKGAENTGHSSFWIISFVKAAATAFVILGK